MSEDVLDRLYAIASDGEAAMLDDLMRRAGVIWTCDDCKWHNRDGGDTALTGEKQCSNCGAEKPS